MTTPVDVGTVVTSIAGDVSSELINALTVAVPVVLPTLAVFWGVRFVMKKIGLGKAKA